MTIATDTIAIWTSASMGAAAIGYGMMLVAEKYFGTDSIVEMRADGKLWDAQVRYTLFGRPFVCTRSGEKILLNRDGSTTTDGARWMMVYGPDPFPGVRA